MVIFTALNTECKPCASCEKGSDKVIIAFDYNPDVLICRECLAKLAIEIIKYLKD